MPAWKAEACQLVLEVTGSMVHVVSPQNLSNSTGGLVGKAS